MCISDTQKENPLRKNMLLALSIVVVLVLSACAPVTSPTPAPAEQSPPAETAVIQGPAEVPRISVEEAKAYYDEGTAVFVDSRSRSAYDVEHIAGALPSPTGDLSELGNTIPQDQLIIAYCT